MGKIEAITALKTLTCIMVTIDPYIIQDACPGGLPEMSTVAPICAQAG